MDFNVLKLQSSLHHIRYNLSKRKGVFRRADPEWRLLKKVKWIHVTFFLK